MNSQFDERDNVFSRRDLIEGESDFTEYYDRHPELLEIDREFRAAGDFGKGVPPLDFAMFGAASWLMTGIGKPEIVDGKSADKNAKASPERFTEKIKAYSRLLGADLVGISELKSPFIYSHRGRKSYPEKEPYGSPINLTHKYAISLGFRENTDLINTAPFHSEMIETGKVYLQSAIVSVAIARYIRLLGYPARAHHFRNYQVLPVPLAVEAGLGELGRCGFLITREFGNCLRLSTVTTDLPLICDNPIDFGIQDFCRMCKLCAEACPSGAIPEGGKTEVRGYRKWQLDDVKCITQWHRMGTDCGMCIGSCPWSLPNKWWHRISAAAASKSHLARVILLWLYPIVFGKYKPGKIPEWLES